MTPLRSKRIDLRRPTPTRDQNHLYLILHEPGVQEEYLQWIKRVLRHNHIVLQPMDSTSAETQIRTATALRRNAQAQGSPYDEVWCVFNADQRSELVPALELAKKLKIAVAVIAPSFELWLMLHFQDVKADHSADEILAGLAKFIPNYSGSLRNQEHHLFHKYEIARTRALALPVSGRSRTNLFELVDSIKKSRENFLGGPHNSAL